MDTEHSKKSLRKVKPIMALQIIVDTDILIDIGQDIPDAVQTM